MCLKSLDRLRHTTGFHLTVWYAALFILHTLALGSLAYALLSASLQERDRQSIVMELHELAALYHSSGVTGLQQELEGAEKPFFVRLAGADRATLLFNLPDQWAVFTLQPLETMSAPADVTWHEVASHNDDHRLEVASLGLADGVLLQVGQTTEDRSHVLKRFRAILALVMLPVIALGFTGGAVLALRTLRPLRSLIRTVRSIEAGVLDMRVATRQTENELDELGRLFNKMLDKIAVLIQGMSDALDNVAHELRTPVARIRASAEVALQAEEDPALYREAIADCMEESERLLTMLHTLMDISEAETEMMKLALEPVHLAELLADAVDLYRYVTEDSELTVSTTAPPTLWLMADRNRLRQVIANLLDNAIKYTPRGGQITLTACRERTWVVVVVADTGSGMTPEVLSHIWDRLYRGDKSRSHRGLGLGLSLVKAVVQAHKGSVAVATTPGGGSQFTLRFPETSTNETVQFPVADRT
jgi:signal transduction histidine kinase